MQINHFFLEVSEPKIHSKYNLEIQVVEETGTLRYNDLFYFILFFAALGE